MILSSPEIILGIKLEWNTAFIYAVERTWIRFLNHKRSQVCKCKWGTIKHVERSMIVLQMWIEFLVIQRFSPNVTEIRGIVHWTLLISIFGMKSVICDGLFCDEIPAVPITSKSRVAVRWEVLSLLYSLHLLLIFRIPFLLNSNE